MTRDRLPNKDVLLAHMETFVRDRSPTPFIWTVSHGKTCITLSHKHTKTIYNLYKLLYKCMEKQNMKNE